MMAMTATGLAVGLVLGVCLGSMGKKQLKAEVASLTDSVIEKEKQVLSVRKEMHNLQNRQAIDAGEKELPWNLTLVNFENELSADFEPTELAEADNGYVVDARIADIAKMLECGINVTIGTDGPASNNSLDMFKEMFLVATLSKVLSGSADVVSASDVIRMATINGARAMGINSGEIKPGKLADIILININSPHYFPQDNLVSHLVYAGKSSDVYLTMIGGKIVYENGKYNIGEDEKTILKKVNIIRQRLKNSAFDN